MSKVLIFEGERHELLTEAERQERTEALLQKIARLTPATRDYHPGIGEGMLNNLIDEAKRLLA